MTQKDLEDRAADIVRKAAELKPGVRGHTDRTQKLVGRIIALVRGVQRQAESDDLAMLTGEKMPEPKGRHRKEEG